MSPRSSTEPVDFVTGAPTSSGPLAVRWNHGVRPGSGDREPAIQVHRQDDHTFVLRQSKTVSYEVPFLYLFFGNVRALLLDTAATGDPARFPGREEITGTPGHHEASISVFDPWTGFLLTGDTVYPGRLYVHDMPAFIDSLERLLRLGSLVTSAKCWAATSR